MNRPRTANSNRSRAISCGCPIARGTTPTERASHSAARFAVHGASSGTCFAIRSSFGTAPSAIDADRERADLRDQPRVAAGATVADQEVRALDPRLVRVDADLVREPEDRVVLRREPRAAAIDRRCRRRAAGSRSGRRRGRALRARRPTSRLLQPPRGREPGVPGADDTDVRIDPLGHARRTVHALPTSAGHPRHRVYGRVR